MASAGSALALGSPSGALTAVSRVSNTIKVGVDWTGDYSAQDAYWFAGNPWSRFTLSGRQRRFRNRAVAPSCGPMDVSGVAMARFDPARILWTAVDTDSGGPAGSDCPRWRRHRVARAPNHVDVFYVTFSGGIDEAAL